MKSGFLGCLFKNLEIIISHACRQAGIEPVNVVKCFLCKGVINGRKKNKDSAWQIRRRP